MGVEEREGKDEGWEGVFIVKKVTAKTRFERR